MSTPSSAVVVPTLGKRDVFLRQCLQSIRDSGLAHISLVSPNQKHAQTLLRQGLIDQHVPDSSNGLAGAINLGIRALPKNIRFVNWLGDDDLLKAGALTSMERCLEDNPMIGLVFGRCSYIDENNRQIWRNRSGEWASLILPFGPCLVPQPGALFRRDLFDSLNGLNEDLKWAFDLDLFLRFRQKATLTFVPSDVASFRWHPDSLSVGGRRNSVNEASRVRQMHLHPLIRPMSFIWEIPVRHLTYAAGIRLNSRTKQ